MGRGEGRVLAFGRLSQNPMSDEGQTCFYPSRKTTAGVLGGVPIDVSTPDVFCLSFNRYRKVVQNPQVTDSEGGVVVKPNTAGGSVDGLDVTIEKWSRTPTLSKLTHVIISCGDLMAGRLRPSSKSGPDMIISCGDLRLAGSICHRKVVQNPTLYTTTARKGLFYFHSFSARICRCSLGQLYAAT